MWKWPKKEKCQCLDFSVRREDCTHYLRECIDCGKVERIERVRHDWEVVSIGDYAWCEGSGEYVFFPDLSEWTQRYLRRSRNRVCLICGECDRSADEAEQAFFNQKKTKADRKERAMKLFEANCCEGDKHA